MSSANIMSGIFKYFKQTTEVKLTKTREMAAKEVKKAAAEAAQAGVKKGHYDFLTDESKAKVIKYRMVLLHRCEILKRLKSFQT